VSFIKIVGVGDGVFLSFAAFVVSDDVFVDGPGDAWIVGARVG